MRRAALLAVLALAVLPAAGGRAELLLSQAEALRLAFPAADRIERRTAFLGEGQAARAQRLARAKVDSLVWTYYIATSSSGILGYAYFDRVVVRTLPAALMAVVDPRGRLRRFEALAFAEPMDYLPRRRWLELFRGRGLGDDLSPGRGVDAVSGATLTTHAFASSARRMLAIHAVLHGAREDGEEP